MVEFSVGNGQRWTANFAPGFGTTSGAFPHPDGSRVLVIASGDVWVVDPMNQSAEQVFRGINAVWPVSSPDGFILEWQGLAFVRFGAAGVFWHTRRLSWDGFEGLEVGPGQIIGQAWSSIEEGWLPFEVDLATGAVAGGAYHLEDGREWEQLASSGAA